MGNTLLCCLLLWGAAIGQEQVTDEVPPEEDVVVTDLEVTEEEDDGHVSVHTFLGVAKGVKTETESGTPYFTFKGIPYAQPPVGSLRFQPPQPSSSWGDTLVATEYGPVCPHKLSFGEDAASYVGEEDCLYLNIYTPTLTRSTNPFALKAVMLWIHGGAFTEGSGSVYDPVYFMEKDVVVVTINYRLNSLGFLTFGNDLASGNLGLRDQQLAIQWTSSNILDEEMLDCLQEIPAQELMEGLAVDASGLLGGDTDYFSFPPVVDHFCSNPFLPIHPLEAMKTGAYNKVPYMSGTTKEDGAMFTMWFWDYLEL